MTSEMTVARTRRAREVRRLRRSPRERLARAVAWGGALVALGVLALLQGVDAFPPAFWRDALPALFAWAGLASIVLDFTATGVVRGVQRLAIAAWLFVVLRGVGGHGWWDTWPVLLVIAGLSIVARALFDRRDPEQAR